MENRSFTHHVVPNPKGGWDVKRGGFERAILHADTQQEAIDVARQLSQTYGTELKIHNLGPRHTPG